MPAPTLGLATFPEVGRPRVSAVGHWIDCRRRRLRRGRCCAGSVVQGLQLSELGSEHCEVLERRLVHAVARELEGLDAGDGRGLLRLQELGRLDQPRRHSSELALQVVERLAHLAEVDARLGSLSCRLQALEVNLHGQDRLVKV